MFNPLTSPAVVIAGSEAELVVDHQVECPVHTEVGQ